MNTIVFNNVHLQHQKVPIICGQKHLLPNLLYTELLSIFNCLATFLSLPVRSGFEELFPMRTFFTVSQSRDTVAQSGEALHTIDVNVLLSSVTQ